MTTAVGKSIKDFYVVGGTMPGDAPSYVERPADKEIFASLIDGEFCHVLTERQMGKSSLMVRTAAKLREAGIDVHVLDITGIGLNVTPDHWYAGMLVQIEEQLNLQNELKNFWIQHTHLGPMQRFLTAIRKEVMPRHFGPLVIFIDEIDEVRSLEFSTDEFFAGIRECYNLRSEDHDIRRLTFCLLGAARPSDLIKDTRTTPFNIGKRIELTNFTDNESESLAAGLGKGDRRNRALLNRVMYWTAGHPYLTQHLCWSIAQDKTIQSDGDVDRLVDQFYFSRRIKDSDNNLIFVQDRLLRSDVDVAELMGVYSRIRRRKPVTDDESHPLVSILRLSGITRTENGFLRVRNRIYHRVFNEKWIESCLPDFEIKRQKEAYRRGVLRTAAVSTVIVAIVAVLAVVAVWQRNLAFDQASINHRLLYLARMKLVQQEWQNANVGRMQELLDATTPTQGEKDLRGFEWYLFSNFTHADSFGIKEPNPVTSVRFVRDSNTLAIGEAPHVRSNSKRQYKIKLHDLKTGEDFSPFSADAGTHFDTLVFSPDGRYVATDTAIPDTENDKNRYDVTLWDVQSRQIKHRLEGHRRVISSVAFAPDSQFLVTADLAGVFTIWDTETGRPRLTRNDRTHWIGSVAVSGDGRLIAITDESRGIQIVETTTGKDLPPVVIEGAVLARSLFSSDGKKLIATDTQGGVYYWDLPARRLIASFSAHASEITALSLSPDGQTLATGSIDRIVKLWDVSSRKEIRTIRGHGSLISSIDWSPDSKSLVTADSDGTIKVWDITVKQIPILPAESIVAYYSTAFTITNEPIALGMTAEARIKLWDLSTGREIYQLSDQTNSLLCSAFSDDARMFAIGSMEEPVKIRETDTGRLISTLDGPQPYVYNVDFSPDGKTIVTGDERGNLVLWEVSIGRRIGQIETRNGYYRAKFSPDGRLIAHSNQDGTVELWDVKSASPIKTLRGHTSAVRAIAFSADGRLLATGADDNTVRIWDIASGDQLHTAIESYSTTRLAFTPDNLRLVTVGQDGSVKLWDLTDMQEVVTLKDHGGNTGSISFSKDCATLAVTLDAEINIWRRAITNN